MACPICNETTCCCSNSTVSRYSGPDIPELGISTGDLIEVVIQNISQYITEGVAISTLTDNNDGTYTHTPGDGSGASTTFTTGKHTTGASPHSSPKYGDTWYDTGSGQLKWFTNNGSVDIWATATASSLPRFKESTIHHNASTVLALDPALHSKREIHFEGTGDISLGGNDYLSSDDYTFLLVNTTASDRLITFSNVSGAWIRDGGAILDKSGTGFTVPSNTTLMLTVSSDGTNVYVNGHFYALEVAGDPTNVSSSTISLVALTPYTLNIATMARLESLIAMDSSGVNITNAISVTVSEPNVTFESNVSISNIEVRIIYSV